MGLSIDTPIVRKVAGKVAKRWLKLSEEKRTQASINKYCDKLAARHIRNGKSLNYMVCVFTYAEKALASKLHPAASHANCVKHCAMRNKAAITVCDAKANKPPAKMDSRPPVEWAASVVTGEVAAVAAAAAAHKRYKVEVGPLALALCVVSGRRVGEVVKHEFTAAEDGLVTIDRLEKAQSETPVPHTFPVIGVTAEQFLEGVNTLRSRGLAYDTISRSANAAMRSEPTMQPMREGALQRTGKACTLHDSRDLYLCHYFRFHYRDPETGRRLHDMQLCCKQLLGHKSRDTAVHYCTLRHRSAKPEAEPATEEADE